MLKIRSLTCAAIAAAMIGIAALAPAVAQEAQTPVLKWHGTFTASVHSVVLGVTTTITDTMVIVLEYDPRSYDPRGNQGRGTLTGSLAGNRSFNVRDHPDCNWTITIPNKLRGKLAGSYSPGARAMSIQLVDPEVAPAPKKDCPGGGYIYSGDSLHEDPDFQRVLESPRAAVDGAFRSSFTQTTSFATGTVTYSLSLTLHGTDCRDYLPDRGFVFYTGPGGAHSDPSTDSPIVGQPAVGGRYVFTSTTRSASGQRWFQVVQPGGPTAWVPASAISCVRPTVLPPPRPTGPPRDMPPLATVTLTGGDPEICDSDSVSRDVDAYGLFFGWIANTFGSFDMTQYERCLRGFGGLQGTGGRG